jgi:hypothetical protein
VRDALCDCHVMCDPVCDVTRSLTRPDADLVSEFVARLTTHLEAVRNQVSWGDVCACQRVRSHSLTQAFNVAVSAKTPYNNARSAKEPNGVICACVVVAVI